MQYARVHCVMRLSSGACLSEFSFYASKDPNEIISFYDTVPQSLLSVCLVAANLENSLRMTIIRDSAIAKDRYQVQIYK